MMCRRRLPVGPYCERTSVKRLTAVCLRDCNSNDVSADRPRFAFLLHVRLSIFTEISTIRYEMLF